MIPSIEHVPSADEIMEQLRDPQRLLAVRHALTTTTPDSVHSMVRELAEELHVALVAVTILDEEYQYVLSASDGSRERCAAGTSGCQYVIGSGRTVALSSATSQPIRKLLASFLPLNAGLAYLGVPLKRPDGQVLGAVCMVDDKPRHWTAQEHFALYQASELIKFSLFGKE